MIASALSKADGWRDARMAKAIAVETTSPSPFAWIRQVSRYQWTVLFVAWLGWVFDSMDGTLFSLVQKTSIIQLLGPNATDQEVGLYSSVVFSAMLIGWALGGIIFGIVADYIGRTRALLITILIYSLFTGLSAAAGSWWQLAAFRFITGLGLGGEWAAGAALVAEVWPDRLRAKAGAILQSAAAVGYFLAAVTNLTVGVYSWRYVYLVGAAPALLVMLIRMLVKEPEKWVAANNERKRAKSESSDRTDAAGFTLKQLFGPRLRRDTLTASSLAFVVLLALWGATMWIPSAIQGIAKANTVGLAPHAAQRYLAARASYGIMLLNAGSLFGYLSFGLLADRWGRRATFLFFFCGGLILFPVTFLLVGGLSYVYALLPLLGFFTLGITSGFPIYLPELFPTQVRTTGVGFCYNLGRLVTAGGVFLTGYLVGAFGGSYAKAASAVSLVYVLGIVVLIFARETKGTQLE
jgi:MFS family permease